MTILIGVDSIVRYEDMDTYVFELGANLPGDFLHARVRVCTRDDYMRVIAVSQTFVRRSTNHDIFHELFG